MVCKFVRCLPDIFGVVLVCVGISSGSGIERNVLASERLASGLETVPI
jgi:hypothetical protein